MVVINAVGGVEIRLVGAEALILLEELGDSPAKGKQKMRQLHEQLTSAMRLLGRDSEREDQEREKARTKYLSDFERAQRKRAKEEKAKERAQAVQARAEARERARAQKKPLSAKERATERWGSGAGSVS
jgi:hypothetical protein